MGFPILVRWHLYIDSAPRYPVRKHGWIWYYSDTGNTDHHFCISVNSNQHTFLFLSDNGDIVICFSCGGRLDRWQPSDDPWLEHAHWFPHCSFLIQTKGPEFVETVIRNYGDLLAGVSMGSREMGPLIRVILFYLHIVRRLWNKTVQSLIQTSVSDLVHHCVW